jgi:hypothetical protein
MGCFVGIGRRDVWWWFLLGLRVSSVGVDVGSGESVRVMSSLLLTRGQK